MQTLTYITSVIALAVLARAFFSGNQNDEPIVRADTTEILVEESVILNTDSSSGLEGNETANPASTAGKDLSNHEDSSASANASAQNDANINRNNELIIQPAARSQQPAADIVIPHSVNLNIPFFPQAPDGNRSLPWAEACEEASIALANYFIKDKPLTRDQFRADLLAMVDRQMELFNDYIHTSVAQTKQLYLDFYGGAAYILDDPSIRDMKAILAQGHVIVAPFAGRKLGNPYYSGQGPWYHMFVIRGYDDTYFYTNDVGTRRGENFKYTHAVIMEALHDLNYGDINAGAKRILVITE